jgi:hypothetical protein
MKRCPLAQIALFFPSLWMAAVLSAALSGCGGRADSQPAPADAAPSPPNSPAAAAGLALLEDEAQRAAAARQRICPVTGELLGSMGKPPLVAINTRTVFLCCEHCESALRQNPDKHLANLQ